MSEAFNNTVSFILVMVFVCGLFAARACWEKYREWKKRSRFEWQVKRWSL